MRGGDERSKGGAARDLDRGVYPPCSALQTIWFTSDSAASSAGPCKDPDSAPFTLLTDRHLAPETHLPCLEPAAPVRAAPASPLLFPRAAPRMRLALLLVALGCLGAARAQLPALPASCQGVVTSLTGLLGAQTEIDAACPKTATSCSEACKAALSKVRRRQCGRRAVKMGQSPSAGARLSCLLTNASSPTDAAVRLQDG